MTVVSINEPEDSVRGSLFTDIKGRDYIAESGEKEGKGTREEVLQ